jgi:hypothetical protein
MHKSHKKALRFAYDLLCGHYRGQVLSYVYSTVPRDLRGDAEFSPAPWIEPDRDATRAYLNEGVFTTLVMNGYFECQPFLPGPVWLYRLSRDGCAKMGWTWPTHLVYPLTLWQDHKASLARFHKPPRRFEDRQPHRRKMSYDPHRFRRSNDWRKQ